LREGGGMGRVARGGGDGERSPRVGWTPGWGRSSGGGEVARERAGRGMSRRGGGED
jgi:hypothetical protein